MKPNLLKVSRKLFAAKQAFVLSLEENHPIDSVKIHTAKKTVLLPIVLFSFLPALSHAIILSDSSSRRVTSYGNKGYISSQGNPASSLSYYTNNNTTQNRNYPTSSYNQNYNRYNPSQYNRYIPPSQPQYTQNYQNNDGNTDRMGALIQKKNQEYQQNAEAFYRSYGESNAYTHPSDNYSYNSSWGSSVSFDEWLNNYYNRQRADEYQAYLSAQVGQYNVPPMSQLLTTARSWSKCGESKYEVPPKYLWNNMVSTLRLLAELKNQGILPRDTIIRSTYRNPNLNRCAGGAPGSKHKINAAMDLWVPAFDYDIWLKQDVQNRLCDFWLYNGKSYNFGLGIYSTGAIHIDADGYRKWGANYASSSSSCRF